MIHLRRSLPLGRVSSIERFPRWRICAEKALNRRSPRDEHLEEWRGAVSDHLMSFVFSRILSAKVSTLLTFGARRRRGSKDKGIAARGITRPQGRRRRVCTSERSARGRPGIRRNSPCPREGGALSLSSPRACGSQLIEIREGNRPGQWNGRRVRAVRQSRCHSSGVARCLIAWASCGRHEERAPQSWIDLKLRGASAEPIKTAALPARRSRKMFRIVPGLFPSQIMSPKSAASAMARSFAA